MRKVTTSRCALRGRHLRRRNFGAVPRARSLGPATQFRFRQTAIRKTTQENDAKTLAQNFERQTNSMYEAFKKSTKAEPYLQNCLDTARQIDKIMTSTPLDPAANTQWSTVKTERNTLANAFNVPRGVIGYC